MTVIIDITQLSPGTVKPTDVYPAVDVTDVTQAATGTTKKYEVSQLLTILVASLGLTTYQSCITCSTVNLNANYNNGISGVGATLTNAGTKVAFTLNGLDGILHGRYLIKDQTDPSQNGIYTLTAVGDNVSINWVLTRAIDFNSSSNIINDGVVFSTTGTVNPNTLWKVNFSGIVVVGTTLLNWSLFSFVDFKMIWNLVTGTTQQIANNNGYVPRNVALTTFTLPLTANVGDVFEIRGYAGTGGWKINQNANQQIYVGNRSSIVGVTGYIASSLATNSALVTCIDNDNIFSVVPVGNLTIV